MGQDKEEAGLSSMATVSCINQRGSAFIRRALCRGFKLLSTAGVWPLQGPFWGSETADGESETFETCWRCWTRLRPPRSQERSFKSVKQTTALEGYGCDYYWISPTNPAVQRGLTGVCFQGSLSFALLFGLFLGANHVALQRSKAQFGVAPHLCTNFRVSRMPNRSTALPWQRLTAKSTVFHLIGPQIISHRYTQPIIAIFFQQGTFRRGLILCFWPVKHFTLFIQCRGNAVASVQHYMSQEQRV